MCVWRSRGRAPSSYVTPYLVFMVHEVEKDVKGVRTCFCVGLKTYEARRTKVMGRRPPSQWETWPAGRAKGMSRKA